MSPHGTQRGENEIQEADMKEETQVVGTRAYRVRTSEDGEWGCFSWRPVNPKTGKGWQAPRDTQTFYGPRAAAKATRAWLYAVLRAKKALAI